MENKDLSIHSSTAYPRSQGPNPRRQSRWEGTSECQSVRGHHVGKHTLTQRADTGMYTLTQSANTGTETFTQRADTGTYTHIG